MVRRAGRGAAGAGGNSRSTRPTGAQCDRAAARAPGGPRGRGGAGPGRGAVVPQIWGRAGAGEGAAAGLIAGGHGRLTHSLGRAGARVGRLRPPGAVSMDSVEGTPDGRRSRPPLRPLRSNTLRRCRVRGAGVAPPNACAFPCRAAPRSPALFGPASCAIPAGHWAACRAGLGNRGAPSNRARSFTAPPGVTQERGKQRTPALSPRAHPPAPRDHARLRDRRRVSLTQRHIPHRVRAPWRPPRGCAPRHAPRPCGTPRGPPPGAPSGCWRPRRRPAPTRCASC
jgi:hypothetical protein